MDMDKDIKYSVTAEITISPDGTIVGKATVYHANVAADLNISKRLSRGVDKRTEALSMSNKLLRLSYDFIASAVVRDEPVGPTGPRPEDTDG